MIAAQQGLPDDAIRDFQQSLLLRPTYAIALLNLGNVYRRQRNFEKAEQCLSQALALQPDNPEVNYSFGMLLACLLYTSSPLAENAPVDALPRVSACGVCVPAPNWARNVKFRPLRGRSLTAWEPMV